MLKNKTKLFLKVNEAADGFSIYTQMEKVRNGDVGKLNKIETLSR